jgi:cyclopropane fatty-acyl-phospholipid synthase-like methyltransferase
MNLPFAESAEQNKAVIYDAIKPYLQGEVLEIGSGTGQHAVFFASQVPQLQWQTSELASNLSVIEAWIEESGLTNLLPPIALEVSGQWPQHEYDLVYSANCFHIMGSDAVAKSIRGAAGCLKPGAVLAVYGPFNYNGQFTSESNAHFDQFLRSRDAESGIRDFEWVDGLASEAGLQLLEDISMPANNRSLVWKKRTL